jgi:hemerythrin-like domain-containing protein
MSGAGIDALRAEHETILLVMDRLEDAARSAADGQIPPELVRAALDFIHIYVDGSHHAKEEGALFVAMAENRLLARLADTLTLDHDEGRMLVAAIERALLEERPATGPVLGYAAFIQHHIRRENEMVFDAVEKGLSEPILAELDARFREIESEVLGSDVTTRLLTQLDAAYERDGR